MKKKTFSRLSQCVAIIELSVNRRHANQLAFSPSVFQHRGVTFVKKKMMSLKRSFRMVGKRFMAGLFLLSSDKYVTFESSRVAININNSTHISFSRPCSVTLCL